MLLSVTLPRWALTGAVLVALVVGYFVGREHLKYQIRMRIAEVAEAFGKGLARSFGGATALDKSHESVEATVTARAVMDAYRPHLKLYDVRASYEDNLLYGRVATVRGKLKNNGNKMLTEVQVTAYFLDGAGNRIYEEDCPDDGPLKPGYIRNFDIRATGCPTEWKPGAAECEITQIEFAQQ